MAGKKKIIVNANAIGGFVPYKLLESLSEIFDRFVAADVLIVYFQDSVCFKTKTVIVLENENGELLVCNLFVRRGRVGFRVEQK